jgi:hypothetical protein
MAIRILNNMARKLNGFFLEEAPCGSTGFFTIKQDSRHILAWGDVIVDTVVRLGRYAELLAYDDNTESIYLEPTGGLPPDSLKR